MSIVTTHDNIRKFVGARQLALTRDNRKPKTTSNVIAAIHGKFSVAILQRNAVQ
jgi:hypothetical protein